MADSILTLRFGGEAEERDNGKAWRPGTSAGYYKNTRPGQEKNRPKKEFKPREAACQTSPEGAAGGETDFGRWTGGCVLRREVGKGLTNDVIQGKREREKNNMEETAERQRQRQLGARSLRKSGWRVRRRQKESEK